MLSDQATDANELQLEVMEESESADNTQNSGNAEGESEGEKVTLKSDEEVVKQSPQEQAAKVQEEAWLTKVVEGKAAVEDAPKWLQARLNSRLDATNKVPETEEVVKKILSQEREAQEFKDLQAQIPKLTPLQAKELQDKFQELKPLGNTKALKTALDLLGLSAKIKEAEARGVAKGRLSFPKSGQPSVRKSEQAVGGVPLDVIHDDKKWNEMIRQGQA